MSDDDPEVIRWFTRARKFPRLIGRTPDGWQIPFGPYTITQFVSAFAVMVIGVFTQTLWAKFGTVGNIGFAICVVAGVVYGTGRIPAGARNPVSVAAGLWKATFAPSTGKVSGRPIRLRRPHRVRQRLVIHEHSEVSPAVALLAEAPVTVLETHAAASPQEASPPRVPSPHAAPPLTGVQALLASHPSEK